MDQTSDSVQTNSNFVCELGQIMTRYDFLLARRGILNNVRTDSNLRKKVQSGANHLIRFYSALNCGEFFFAIQKADFGDIALCSKERRVI